MPSSRPRSAPLCFMTATISASSHLTACRSRSKRFCATRFVRAPAASTNELLAGEDFVHVTDLAAVTDVSVARAAVEIAGFRTVLFVPLRKDGRLLGYITTYRKQVRPFAVREIALLQNLTAQAVIAIENGRL